MKTVITNSLQKSINYAQYRAEINRLIDLKLVTGNLQNEDLFNYSLLNITRMNRLDKTIEIKSEVVQKIQQLKNNYILLVLSEGWCGDAAQIIPVLQKLTSVTSKIDLKLVFRDENDALMQFFLTNNSKSIPKIIFIQQDTFEVKGSWGPRPQGATKLIKSYKEQFGLIDEKAKTDLQLWYLHDKGYQIQKEITDLLVHLETLGH